MSLDAIQCAYEKVCSGCQHLHVPYAHQSEVKTRHLQDLFDKAEITVGEPIEFVSCGPFRLRDRLDFSLQMGRLGLFDKDHTMILDLPICEQLSPELQAWLTEFRSVQWPFQKGSIRLRINSAGKKGVWLDFANVDIKALLEEKSILDNLLKIAHVEIGQRRKVPVMINGEYKLREPTHQVWFQTWVGEQPLDLYCQVASFTQPSLKANKTIANLVSSWIQEFPKSLLIEFGSGIGNLTLPALAACESLLACEIDELALQGFEQTLSHLPENLQNLRQKLEIHAGDFQKKLTEDFSKFDGVLANPPRSGLMNFLNPLEHLSPSQRPEFFIYMSCFPESLVKDITRLQAFGYKLKRAVIVDQFPQTAHFEVLTLLQKN